MVPPALPPPLSCDSHCHILGDAAIYPYNKSWPYVPPSEATFAALTRMHRALGFGRAILVQPLFYDMDHRLLLETLAGNPNTRGVATVTEPVEDRTIEAWHAAGVRGVRFGFSRGLGERPSVALLRRVAAQVAPFGWHIKILARGAEWMELADVARELTIPAVIDHLGFIDPRLGSGQPPFRLFLDLLKRGNWWVLLGNCDRVSAAEAPWEDVVPFARGYIEAAPDRVLWGFDWPHLGYGTKPIPSDAALLELFYRLAPDPALQAKILIENPARLVGFAE